MPLCVFQSWTGAYEKLTTNLPQESLFSPPVVISVLGSAVIQLAFQLYLWNTTRDRLGEENYIVCISSEELEEDDPPCSDNSVIYLFTCMQYITCCLCFSISKPFRKPIWTNPLYLCSVIFMLTYQIYLILGYDTFNYDLFDLVELP